MAFSHLQKRGNVIKVDRHKYVKVAYHGFRCLSSEERNAAYNHSAVSALQGLGSSISNCTVNPSPVGFEKVSRRRQLF
jgi:hypothetical protein